MRWGLESVEPPVVLIAGGRDKGADFASLRDLVKERCRAVVAIGEARPVLRRAYSDATRFVEAGSMHEAVKRAMDLAEPGDTVILSPGCASFDMFRDFEERGREFKHVVSDLTGGGGYG
jgi:UDP-N-acetylmuramoylalanine--D-glutamate ligase